MWNTLYNFEFLIWFAETARWDDIRWLWKWRWMVNEIEEIRWRKNMKNYFAWKDHFNMQTADFDSSLLHFQSSSFFADYSWCGFRMIEFPFFVVFFFIAFDFRSNTIPCEKYIFNRRYYIVNRQMRIGSALHKKKNISLSKEKIFVRRNRFRK